MTDYAQLAKDIVEATLLGGVDPDMRDDMRDELMSEMYISPKGIMWYNYSATGAIVRFWEHNGRGYANSLGIGSDGARHQFDRPLNALDCAAWAAEHMC
ncbi:hypothetical protein SEA_AMORE2_101 [Gordonia phage Amore2]|nr:hypothetical protein SEA_AMORE2_101 [Gordonia phage Amore2]